MGFKAPSPSTIVEESDVNIVAPVPDQILEFDGTKWINGVQIASAPGQSVMFFLDSTKIIPAGAGPETVPLETLLKTPSAGGEAIESATVNNSTELIDQYLYNTALGIISIPAGEWTFDTYCFVDNAAGVSEVIESIGRVFIGAGTVTIAGAGVARTATVAAGTPFIASDFNADITLTSYIITPNAVLRITGFTSTSVVTVETLATYTNEVGVAYSVDRFLFQDTTGEINNLAVALVEHTSVQQAFAINTTDKLSVRYYAKTDNVGNIIVSITHNGTQHYTHFHTPLPLLHNDLADIQGGALNESFHMTSAEYTGVGTGVFVRVSALPSGSASVVTEQAFGQASTAGVAATFSKGDHTHGTPATPAVPSPAVTVVSETAFGQASAVGIDATYAREDHTHGTPASPVINKGVQWVQHGDNVITLASAQSSTSYRAEASIKLAAMGGVTARGPWHNTNPMTPTVYVDLNDANNLTRLKVRLHGGFGFTSCGYTGAVSGVTERFDDIANSQTGRTAATARYGLTGYSLNGFGFTSCGFIAAVTGVTERFDDVINTWTARTAATARQSLAGYTINGFGFTSCGYIAAVTGTTERFDDVANSQTARTAATARYELAGFGLNNYGFTAYSIFGTTVQRFDDVANTQTGRAVGTGIAFTTGCSLNGYGFTSCGSTGAPTGITQRFDDIANTWTARTAATSRNYPSGYSLNGFGFTNGGDTSGAGAYSAVVERFDDIANSQTARTSLATARRQLAGFSTNEYFVNYITEDV